MTKHKQVILFCRVSYGCNPMLRSFWSKIPQVRHKSTPLSLSKSRLYSTSPHTLNKNVSSFGSKHSPTISDLQISCGLSLESAISASERVQVENTKDPDSVLNLLRSHGLTQIHIQNLITSRPELLLADVESMLKPNLELFKSLGISTPNLANMLNKEPRILAIDAKKVVEFFKENGFTEKQISTLAIKYPRLYLYNASKSFKPKLEFLKSLGISELLVSRMVLADPHVLRRSLENSIMPRIQELKRVLGSDEDVLKAIKSFYQITQLNLGKVLEPNMRMLASHGVPKSLILKILLIQPQSLLQKTDRFIEIVSEVKKLGFDPTNLLFVLAIRTLALSNKTLWEKKLEALRSYGLSVDEVYSAFKRQPMCMMTSVNKIRKLMSFYVNTLNLEPFVISKNPGLLLLSLERRIIPRCSVLQILMSKGLIGRDCKLVRTFKLTEKVFVKRFVSKYQGLAPEVVEAHQGKVDFQGFP